MTLSDLQRNQERLRDLSPNQERLIGSSRNQKQLSEEPRKVLFPILTIGPEAPLTPGIPSGPALPLNVKGESSS